MIGCLDLDDTGRELRRPLVRVTGARAVAVRLWTMLQTQRGTWLPDQRFGLPLLRWRLAGSAVPLAEVEGEIRRAVARVRGVVGVRSLDVAIVDDDLRIGLVAEVQDDTGTATIAIGDVSGIVPIPGAWYVLIPNVSQIVPPRGA